jgi:hypothetical protein
MGEAESREGRILGCECGKSRDENGKFWEEKGECISEEYEICVTEE